MKKITVQLSALMEKLEGMKQDGMEFVELDFVDKSIDCGQICPAFINLLGIRRTMDEYIVDYGSVDEIAAADLGD